MTVISTGRYVAGAALTAITVAALPGNHHDTIATTPESTARLKEFTS
ncbi:hypothetical protein ACIQOW_19925 [Kitasatospora sp. NPDC091335]